MLSEKFWEEYFRTYDILNIAIPYSQTIGKICEFVPCGKKVSVFDAGSGTGNLSLALKSRGAKVTSLDYSSAGIAIHLQKDTQANIVKGDLTAPLPFADDYFDVIVSNNVIYTLPVEKWDGIFKEFYRVLKKDGIIVISNINKNFKPLNILLSHIKISLADNGILKTVQDFFIFLPAVIKMFYYNWLIKKENKSGEYCFVGLGDQSKALLKAGFSSVVTDLPVYAGQAYLDTAKKI